MWSSDRRRFLLGFLALPACGFTPVYGPDGANDLFGAVGYPAPTTQNEFDVVARLTERLGAPSLVKWKLDFSMSTDLEEFSNSGAVRRHLTGTADWHLTPHSDGEVLAGSVRALAGHTDMLSSATDTGARLSNDAAREDARQRLMVMLADRMVEDISARLALAAS